MKEFWLQKKACTGCGVCTNACAKSAIKLQADEFGFKYPVINQNCVDCDLCQKVCEARIHRRHEHFENPDTYAVWSKDDKIRFSSTSGGAFTELSRTVLLQDGYVVGAQYGKDHLVEHAIVADESGLERIRQSKYVQSDMGMIYSKIKEKLSEGKKVVFCGAPCQVAALYAYLGTKHYENLYTLDFICRGMNSSKAYRAWLDEIEQERKSKVSRVWFKYKQSGWNNSPRCTRLDFVNGKFIVLNQDENLFMTGYLGANLYIRPSCGACEFKGVPRQGDITLADFWGLDEKIDDDKGVSMLLINSESGQRLFEETRERLVVYKRDFAEIFAGNVCFDSSVVISKNSEKFLRDLDKGTFSRVLKRYTRKSIIFRVKQHIKKMILIFMKI